MTATNLTPAEMIFAQRMLPHFMAGKSVEEAARAVLADDERIFSTFAARSHTAVVSGVNDHSGHSYRTRETAGDLIAVEITQRVYTTLRAA